ncbi:probable ATP-dependent DNA helicase RecS [Saccostrea echinata]|uniref:probable ATP-dependent DNA helicase RecS n=1 Tax=Saccostrea echinata TaxID=191078 RepID=UPI002A83B5C4|nr:probable ATP-dependent DNA helicase RecS [Saccostrea echinata]
MTFWINENARFLISVGRRQKMAADSIKKVLKLFNITNIKEEQKQILNLLLKGEDCIAVLPTGYGKSLPYQMLIPKRREMNTDDNSKVIVCSPLIALMREQCERLNSIPGITAVYKGGSQDNDLQKFNVSTIVVDEFHTISTWGEEEGKQAFRKWFSHIGELRSIHPKASILALSATCTKKISKRVSKILELQADTIEIRISPDKENIKLVVKKIPNITEMAMVWVIDALCDKTLPRTILYCSSIKDASNLYSYIITKLPKCAEVQMFHSETPEDIKTKILNELSDEESTTKLVIATSALGMGVDILKYSNVILYGAPKSIVDIVQEIGRVGRDGMEAVALLLHNSYHLRTVDSEVKDFFKTTECRRLSMLAPFLSEGELSEQKEKTRSHSCCDLCADKCDCGSCDLTPLEKLFNVDIEELSDFSDQNSSDTECYYSSREEDNLDTHFFRLSTKNC